MKKIISLLLTTALLLSLFSVKAFAVGDNPPSPTTGPATETFFYGGARVGTYDTHSYKNHYVVNYNYFAGSGLVIDNDAVPGVTYDLASNVLTIENVHQRDNELFIWYMGDDFKLNVVGENELGIIYVYNYFNFHGTSLNIIGNGTLTVNEQLINNEAIHMYADGNDSLMHLDIADSVTVHLYSKDGEDGEEANPVVSLSATTITPAQGGAITVGGVTVPEIQSERIVEEKPESVSVVVAENRDRDVPHGAQLRSKSDPDGVYALADIMDGVTYVVNRYIYVEKLRMWCPDYSFAEGVYVGHRYNKVDFEAEYDYVYGQASTPIKYMPAYKANNRGDEAIQLTKDGEPNTVYIGLPSDGLWNWDEFYAGNYEVKRVTWDDKQEIYIEDGSFKSIDLMANELKENGYHIATEKMQRRNELTVWAKPAPFDDDNWETTRDVLKQKSNPDALYVQIGTYRYSSGETGIAMYRVHYDPENEVHYINYGTYTSDEYTSVSDTQLDDGTADYYYDIETVNQPITVRYLSKNYEIDRDLVNGVQLKKNDDPGAVYAYRQWTHYLENGTNREEYGIIKLQYNDQLGCYVEDSDFEEVEFYDLSSLDGMGCEIVLSEQPLDYVTKGSVYLDEFPVYTDKGGSTYYVDYNNMVYSFTDEDLITIAGEEYYYGIPMTSLSVDNLENTVHEVVTDKYSYHIPGTEYHHIAGEQPDPVAYDLWVNGEQVTSDHLTVTCGKGTATYDPAAHTLTLNNAEITKGTDKDRLYTGILTFLPQLSIVVQGDCTITETNGDGIGSYQFDENYQMIPHDITVCGDGTLTITESTQWYGYGFYCTGNLVLDGIDLTIDSAATGVWAKSLEIRGTTADIHCTTGYSGFVVNNGSFTFEDSTVTAKSEKGAALLLGNNQDSSHLIVNSGKLDLIGKYGVSEDTENGTVTVNGGNLSITSEEGAFAAPFLADNRKNIIYGENIGVVEGECDQAGVIITGKEEPAVLVGDANGDGTVNINDVTAVQRHIAELKELDELQQTAADVNADGDISIDDATTLQQYLAEYETSYPIGKVKTQ